MTLILGLDPAQRTGFAYYDDTRSLSAIQPGSLKVEGESFEERCHFLGRRFTQMLRDKRPDLIACEQPIRTLPAARRKSKIMGVEEAEEVSAVSGLNAMISSNQIVGALSATAGFKGITFITIPTSTWRSQFLGFSRRPGWQRKDWKKACREKCAQLRIPVTNDDAADAVGVAFAAAASQTARMMKLKIEQAA